MVSGNAREQRLSSGSRTRRSPVATFARIPSTASFLRACPAALSIATTRNRFHLRLGGSRPLPNGDGHATWDGAVPAEPRVYVTAGSFRFGRSLALPNEPFHSEGAQPSRRGHYCGRRCPKDLRILRTSTDVERFLVLCLSPTKVRVDTTHWREPLQAERGDDCRKHQKQGR